MRKRIKGDWVVIPALILFIAPSFCFRFLNQMWMAGLIAAICHWSLALLAPIWFLLSPDLLVVDKYGRDKNRLETVYRIPMATWRTIARVLCLLVMIFFLYGARNFIKDIVNLSTHSTKTFDRITGTVTGNTHNTPLHQVAPEQDIYIKNVPNSITFYSSAPVYIGCDYEFLVLKNSKFVVQARKLDQNCIHDR
jgi:hypothetical protein